MSHGETHQGLSAPVLLIHFNRPDLTRRQIEILARFSPPRVWVLTDGPRAGHPTDADRVAAVRSQFESLPWECELTTIHREHNLGVRANISDGITRFLDACEAGIILEDDCLPTGSFLRFADEMLVRYREDERIYAVSGYTGKDNGLGIHESYTFSDYFSCWGWATWRRAWVNYDPDMHGFLNPLHWGQIHRRVFPGLRQRAYWGFILGRVSRGTTDSWAYRYQLSIWLQRGLAIFPNRNLVSNVGFGEDATNTAGLSGTESQELAFPLKHPEQVEASPQLNKWIEDNWHSKSPGMRFRWLLRKLRLVEGAQDTGL
ncbi:hypothetical protein [Coraliomargarita parva]|uniref:hypothetical protein n=1 Tax=Coraliomargarita parva TaxID=3014050 RepID=UPI0022B3D306|nr:hypothetical protein [Coraliomargarita parva]